MSKPNYSIITYFLYEVVDIDNASTLEKYAIELLLRAEKLEKVLEAAEAVHSHYAMIHTESIKFRTLGSAIEETK